LNFKFFKVYPLSLVEQKELNAFLEENLYTRCIYLFKLSMAALVFFIKKKKQLSLIGVGLLSTQLHDGEEQVPSLSYFQTCFLASQN